MDSFTRFLAIPMLLLLFLQNSTGQNTQQDIEIIRANYIHSLLNETRVSQTAEKLLSRVRPNTEFGMIAARKAMSYSGPDVRNAMIHVRNIRVDGTWPSIDYHNKQRSGWKTHAHVARILELTKVYYKHSSLGIGQMEADSLKESIHRAMGYWFKNKPQCRNWFYNQIAVPRTFGMACLLFWQEMDSLEIRSAIDVMKKSKIGMTGQNKVALAGNVLIKALLQNDYQQVKTARDAIVSEIVTGNKEGIQSDWSFHQHGPQQQFGNYGLAYFSNMMFYNEIFEGSSLALDNNQREILTRLFIDGFYWVTWKGYWDVNGLGRQLFPNAIITKSFNLFYSSCSLSRVCQNKDKTKVKEWLRANFISPSRKNHFTGHKHFWDSDQTIHRTRKWMASLKMSSERVIGTELVNEDNLKGFYMGDGALFTYTQGDEYLNVFPFWDWRKIPGITCYQTSDPLPAPRNYGDHVRNRSSFVGGVTDGDNGIASMIIDRDGIKARKVWIFTEEFILCLGSNIHADTSLPLTTSIEQTMKRGELLQFKHDMWLPVTGHQTYPGDGHRFFHANTGYILLRSDTLVALTEQRQGRWSDFMGTAPSTLVNGEIVSLYMTHRHDTPAGYQYLVLPATTPARTARFNTKDILVIRNDKNVQAVIIGKRIHVAAYTSARILLPDGAELIVETPGIYMLERNNKALHAYVADPTHRQIALSFVFNGNTRTIPLTGGETPGRTVYFKWK